MKNLNLKITLAADNTIPAFGAYVNYTHFDDPEVGTVQQPEILINFNAMFSAMVEEKDFGMTYKEFFAENVVHEMLHMVQDIFCQAFDEEEVENAIMQCRKDNK